MAFRFPLEAVYHLRKSIEHQQELRLRAAHQQVARLRHLIQQVDTYAEQLRLEQARTLALGTRSAELQFFLHGQTRLEEQRHILELELVRLEKLRDAQQQVFQEARRHRETFESLRDRQLQEYERDLSRRQQRELDDLFLLRRTYRLQREKSTEDPAG